MKKVLIFIFLNVLFVNFNAFEKETKENPKKRYVKVTNTYPDKKFRGKIFEIETESTIYFYLKTDTDLRWVSKNYAEEITPEEHEKQTKLDEEQKRLEKRARQKRNAKKHLVSKFFNKNPFEELSKLP